MRLFIVDMVGVEGMNWHLMVIFLVLLVRCIELVVYRMVSIIEVWVWSSIWRCEWMFMNFGIMVETFYCTRVNPLIDLMLVWALVMF